jgi:hypothetical protein
MILMEGRTMGMRLFLATAVLLAATTPALAQQQPQQAAPQAAGQQQPQLTPEQREQIARQDAEMTQAALAVMQLVDTNRIGEIWDGASAVMKQAVSKDDFIRQITLDRNRLGSVTGRGNAVVTRSQGQEGSGIPPGLYINVHVPTQFASQQQAVRELVSFRLDEDRTWRVSGYTLR